MRLSVLVFIALSLVSSIGLADMCQRIMDSNSYLGQQCYEVKNGNYFQENVYQLCAEMSSDNGYLAIECLKKIANKTYTKDEFRACRNDNSYLTMSCLGDNGTPIQQ